MDNKYVKIILGILFLIAAVIIIIYFYYPILLALLVFALGYLHFANPPK